MTIELQTLFDKIDIRREKKYGKVVTLRASVPPLEGEGTGWKSTNEASHIVREVVEARPRGEELNKKEIKISVDTCGYYGRGDKKYVFRVTRFLKADKPSQIISNEEARAELPADEVVQEYVKGVISEAQEALTKKLQQEKEDNLTIHLLNWCHRESEERAKKVCRFEQRLQALVAEFKSETMIQSKEVIEECLKEAPEVMKESGWNDNVREEVEKLAKQYVAEHQRDGLPGRFPFHDDDDQNWLEKQRAKKGQPAG